MIMKYEDKIRWLGNQLIGRVREDLVRYAVSYIDNSEIVLSFVTLLRLAKARHSNLKIGVSM